MCATRLPPAVRCVPRSGSGPTRVGTWWDWKPEKQALEHLFNVGELMIARRDRNFQRVYDLRERILPHWNEGDTPTPDAARRAFALKSGLALGVALPRWVPDYFRLPT